MSHRQQLKVSSYEIAGWKVTVQKGPIANRTESDDLGKALRFPHPTMTFPHNQVRLEYSEGGETAVSRSIIFDAIEACKGVSSTSPSDIKIVHSRQEYWRQKQESFDKVLDYDWTYQSGYAGTVIGLVPKSTDKRIDFARLRQSPAGSPILFYDEVCLYEDEMGDNGHAEFTVKLRVMSFGVFVLVRNLIRVDQVIFKCTEHRYFIDFQQDSLILAETRRKSDPYDVILAKLGGSVAAVCSQADQVADQMSIISSNTVEFG